MVWPTASIPTYGRGVWLECNGQSFSRTQFPQLYESLGTNRVPDYRGMFLRGYGSQSYSQDNGIRNGVTSTNYSSGNIGQIQGDAERPWIAYTHSSPAAFGTGSLSDWGYNGSHLQDTIVWVNYDPGYDSTGIVGIPHADSDLDIIRNSSNDGDFIHYPTADQLGEWTDAFKRYRYEISGDAESGYSLNEIEEFPTIPLNWSYHTEEFSNKMKIPTSNEIRPVNVAVKFMIKAK